MIEMREVDLLCLAGHGHQDEKENLQMKTIIGVIPFSAFANFTKLEIRSNKSVCLTPKISNKAIIQQYKHQQPQISGFNTTNKGKEKQQPKQLEVEPGIREVW